MTATIEKTATIEFSCGIGDMAEAVAAVGRAIASRPSHPVLANILLHAAEDSITLTAFDLSLGISVTIPASVKEAGVITVPGKLFADIINRQPSGSMTMAVGNKPETVDANGEAVLTHQISLTFPTGTYKLNGMLPHDFPDLPAVATEPFTLPSDELLGILRRVTYASSSDETKQILTGVHLTWIDGKLEAASTDGHRLAVASAIPDDTIDLVTNPIDLDLTIPAKAVTELVKLCDSAEVKVQCDRGQIRFSGENWLLTSRLLEGQYPNYRQLVPKSFAHSITANRKELMAALERVAIVADQKNNIVKLTFTGMLCELSVDAADVGSANESVPATGGADLSMGFNVKYILETLKNLECDTVQLRANTPTSPAVFVPHDGRFVDSVLSLVMPVQIRS